jgi:hypothetical protein
MGIGKFDGVICFGVLYHLRYLLLGIDMLYAATRGTCFIETAFADNFLPEAGRRENVWLFDRPHVYNSDDHSNWFLPTVRAYENVPRSCGFEPRLCTTCPDDNPHRCAFRCVPRPIPEWIEQGSYEGQYPAKRFRDLVERR